MPGRVLVVGIGLNNRPLLPYLVGQGAQVVVADRRRAEDLDILPGQRVTWCLGPDYLQQAMRQGPYDVVYLTPGMVKDQAEIRQLHAQGSRITCETDLFLSVCPSLVIGVTGSAGKTTTTTLVGNMLSRDGRYPVFVGGNIGIPLLPRLGEMTPEARVVMELSSFQLELVEHSPQGAALLNLSENHLDVHGSMDAYARAKSRVFAFQQSEDWLVLPEQDPEPLKSALTGYRGRIWRFSERSPVQQGTFVQGGYIWWKGDGGARRVFPLQRWRLPGAMNVRNALAATAIALAAGAKLDPVREALTQFRGVPHRLEVIAERGGIRYINDSIATAPDRTLAGLEALSGPLVVIAGGYDKHLDYTGLGRALSVRARAVVLTGQTGQKILAAMPPGPSVTVVEDFDRAVRVALGWAKNGDTVVLSPASASYDQFRNFEERGERFRVLVREFLDGPQ